ncbi:MAG: ATP-binding protein [Promethearchaeota archaeon]
MAIMIYLREPFYNRKSEIKDIISRLNKKEPQYIMVWGRRRVGKSEIVKRVAAQFAKTPKSPNQQKATNQQKQIKKFFYYTAVNKVKDTNIRKMKSDYARCFSDKFIQKINFQDYFELFDYIIDKKGIDLLIIDEYPYLSETDSSLDSTLQQYFDNQFHSAKISVILLGSNLSTMRNLYENISNPLYGRLSYTKKIKQFSLLDLTNFFPKANFEELLHIYGFTGGIPQHLNRIVMPFWDTIEELVSERSYLLSEKNAILTSQFSGANKYSEVLYAIGEGKNKQSEIQNYIKSPPSEYLSKLISAEIIERRQPITDLIYSSGSIHPKVLKNGRYHFKDNFIHFLYRFLDPRLEDSNIPISVNEIKIGYTNYLGDVFESFCREFVRFHFGYSLVGQWWGATARNISNQIDIVAYDKKQEYILIGSCKWTHKNTNPIEEIYIMHKVLPYIKFPKRLKIKVKFIIMAKKLKNRVNSILIEGEKFGVICYDLNDFNKFLGRD